MPIGTNHGITVTDDVYSTLEGIRQKEGLRSIAGTVEFLIRQYKETVQAVQNLREGVVP